MCWSCQSPLEDPDYGFEPPGFDDDSDARPIAQARGEMVQLESAPLVIPGLPRSARSLDHIAVSLAALAWQSSGFTVYPQCICAVRIGKLFILSSSPSELPLDAFWKMLPVTPAIFHAGSSKTLKVLGATLKSNAKDYWPIYFRGMWTYATRCRKKLAPLHEDLAASRIVAVPPGGLHAEMALLAFVHRNYNGPNTRIYFGNTKLGCPKCFWYMCKYNEWPGRKFTVVVRGHHTLSQANWAPPNIVDLNEWLGDWLDVVIARSMSARGARVDQNMVSYASDSDPDSDEDDEKGRSSKEAEEPDWRSATLQPSRLDKRTGPSASRGGDRGRGRGDRGRGRGDRGRGRGDRGRGRGDRGRGRGGNSSSNSND